ncbi:MAG: hypothetical protein AMJ41_03770, partial [candidate division Zixibacteria bacterium DG_27]
TKTGVVGGVLAAWDSPEELFLEAAAASIPLEFNLAQNYPNPFNARTEIDFALKEAGYTTLKIYNLKGQEVKTLLEAEMLPGKHRTIWEGKDNSDRPASSGIYFYGLTCGESYADVKRMVLLK